MTARKLPDKVEAALRDFGSAMDHGTFAQQFAYRQALRAAIAAHVAPPVSASVERRAAFMGVEALRAERDELRILVDEALPYVEKGADVVDGPDGPRPDARMALAGRMKDALGVKS